MTLYNTTDWVFWVAVAAGFSVYLGLIILAMDTEFRARTGHFWRIFRRNRRNRPFYTLVDRNGREYTRKHQRHP